MENDDVFQKIIENEANEIAMKVFDEAEKQKNGMSIEWYIEKIAEKSE